MSKLLFGNNSVVPVKDFRTDFVPGLGIDQSNYANGTIAVDGTVIRNIATDGTSVINQLKNSANDTNQQVAYGYGTTTSGIFASAFGANTYASPYSVAVGSRANASGSGTGYATAVGVFAKSSQYGVALGAYANDLNSSLKKGAIAIGYNTNTGNSHSTIVIGYNSKAYSNNDTYPSIIIGNDIDLSNTYSAIGSVFISSKEKINGNDEQTVESRRTIGQFSVVIGYDAGGDKSVYSAADIVAIGGTARTKYQHGVAIGYAAQAEGNANIAIGAVAIAQTRNEEQGNEENSSIAIGKEARALGSNCFAIGWGSRAYYQHSIAIGREARAGTEGENNYGSIALGSYAQATGTYSIQLGSGSNNDNNTFQVFDYRMLDADGLIPYERLSTYNPIDGQVLSYDRNLGKLKWVDMVSGGSGGGGSYHLPVASSTTLGGVKIGTGLNITLDGTLSVKQDSQKTTWGTITGKLNNQTDLKNALDTKQKVMQYVEMPVATASRDGEVAQYIGEEDTLYKPGQFYQCTEDDYPTATITSDTQWANLEVDPWMFANYIAKYYYNNDLQSVPSKVYAIEYVNQYDGLGWILYENETSVYVKDIYKMGITAEGGEPELGDKVYVQLYMHSAEGYAWRKLLVDAQVSVNNTLTSTSTKQALSANQGRVLNDKIEQLSGISHFLAMWDTDTGIARYLNAGYQYESGDYFIIASIAPDDPELVIKGQQTAGTVYKLYQEDSPEIAGGTFKTTISTALGSNPITGNYTVRFDGPVYVTIDEIPNETFTKTSLGFDGEITGVAGDVVILHYTSDEINYKPAGTVYPGDTPASREITDDPVQISDMYFYDGAHWIFLPSSSRQIAVDEDLDDTSRNPVENRVVTNALAGKLDADSTEGLYATNDEGETQKLSVGSGLAINNGELVNTRTGGTWGQITGNIESQTDLVDYVASHGGGGSSLQLSDVFIKSKNLVEKDGLAEWQMNRYKGGYSDIFFKISSDYDSLKNARNDLYITIARNANTNCARRTSKMTVLDDCNRFKTNKKFYCWKSLGSAQGTYRWDSDNDEWSWTWDDQPKETEYDYFYVEADYADSQELMNDNPVIFTVQTANETFPRGGWGTNFNELYAWGSLGDYDNPDYERCPQYDIDSVVSLYSDFSNSKRSPEYGFGNVVKNEFTKMQCRVYSGTGGKFYFWCGDWTDSLANVYVAAEYDGEEHIPVSNTVPNFMGDLIDWTDVSTLESQFTFVERRSDLDYQLYDGSQSGFRNTIEKLRLSTQDFPDQEDSVGGFDTNWNSYWLDYPIRPIRLADCKIYAYKLPKTYGETQEEQYERSQRFVNMTRKAYSFEEIEANEELKYLITHQDDLIFVLPYDTSYIWMRLFGWQKGVYYRKGDENSGKNGTYAEPWDRHDLYMAIEKTQHPYNCNDIKMFGARRTSFQDPQGKFFQRLQFNLTTGSDLSQHKVNKLHPLNKIIWINGMKNQGLIDQSK